MKIKIWLLENDKKIQDFAHELGVSRNHLGEVINGKKKASPTLAKLIEIKTNGRITEQEILSLYKPKEKGE